MDGCGVEGADVREVEEDKQFGCPGPEC